MKLEKGRNSQKKTILRLCLTLPININQAKAVVEFIPEDMKEVICCFDREIDMAYGDKFVII